MFLALMLTLNNFKKFKSLFANKAYTFRNQGNIPKKDFLRSTSNNPIPKKDFLRSTSNNPLYEKKKIIK